MSSSPESPHLDNHHRNTLRQIFEHPVSHNIEWHAVTSLFDAIGTMAIGGLLVVVAIFLGIEIKAMLIGQSMAPATVIEMRAFLQGREEIAQVYSLITLQLGLDAMVAVKARMREVATPELLIADINRVEAALKARYPQVRWSFFEPDNVD